MVKDIKNGDFAIKMTREQSNQMKRDSEREVAAFIKTGTVVNVCPQGVASLAIALNCKKDVN